MDSFSDGQSNGEQSLRESAARAEQLARLYSVSSGISEAIVRVKNPQWLYELACRIAVEKGLAKLAWVGGHDREHRRVIGLARFGDDDGYVDAVIGRLGDPLTNDSLVGRVLVHGAPIIVNDIANDPAIPWRDYPLRRGFRSFGIFPLRDAGRGATTAALSIYSGSVGFFREEESQMLISMGENIAFAVESARSERALRESEERLRVLNDLADAMRAVSDPERVLPVALRILGQHLRVARCLYANVEADGRCVIPHDYTDGCASMVGQYSLLSFGPELAELARRSAKPVVVRDVATDLGPEAAAVMRGVGIGAMIQCSLFREGSLRAVMVVHAPRPRQWTANEVTLVQEFVERCWATIEQRAAETKLRENQALLRIAGRVARLGGWQVDLPEMRVTWSDEVCAIHDMPPGSSPGLTDAVAFCAPEFQTLVRDCVEACARDGTPYDLEARVITAQKRVLWVRAIGQAERGPDGAIRRILGAFQDIDERRKLEEQLRHAQKMEAIGRLAGSVAHDFNNLLSVILSYSVMLLQDLDEADPQRENVEAIQKAGERAADLTRQLLAFSRRQVLAPRIVDLNTVVREAERILLRLLGEDIELVTRLDGNLSMVKVDPGQIDQVIMNLAVNARDAMPGGGKLTIETHDVVLDADYASEHIGVTPGPHVVLVVSDTGLGMDKEIQARIFEPFFTTKEHGKGTGLGLSMVFGIVQQSGGTIWVDSEPGKGTTFKLYFPSERAGARPEPQTPEPDTLQGSETILLVEDQEEVRTVAGEVLRRCGYQVIETRNPGEAVIECERNPRAIHLLLTDVIMPRMNGRELAERLRRIRPAMRVLYMSGYTDNAIGNHGLLDADVAYLQKPILPATLAARVREVLDAPARRIADAK